ncbi:hypothetical protein Ae201684P_014490 [Aphanomyces euteiches]|nr:hypothetical protein Ae201684P_014490 [Aphanomyces euteiches]
MSETFDAFFADLAVLRRHFRQNPELSLHEFKTQAFVRNYLVHQAHIPAEQIQDCGKTGLVVDILGPTEGPKPAESALTCVAFRGDMDALPMTEKNPHLPYESQSTGVAHMCGHDGHTANLMGFATLVQQRRHFLPPQSIVRLLFQPAEEGYFGTIRHGCLDGVDEVYGYHNWPFPLGNIQVKVGPLMAHGSTFSITISGPGGHGSAPHVTKDPIVAAGQLIGAIQTITSRSLSPHDAAIVSIGQVHGGEADNVIPSSVKLSGTIRDFSPTVESTINQRLETLVKHTCAAFGLEGKLEISDMYAVVVNPDRQANIIREIGMSVVGADRVSDNGLPVCAGEDFTYYLHQRPGCFLLSTRTKSSRGIAIARRMISMIEFCRSALVPTRLHIVLERRIERHDGKCLEAKSVGNPSTNKPIPSSLSKDVE